MITFSHHNLFLFILQCIFRLIEIFGTEYLLQCANEKERSDWVDTISCVVRKLESVSKSSLKVKH